MLGFMQKKRFEYFVYFVYFEYFDYICIKKKMKAMQILENIIRPTKEEQIAAMK